VKELRRALDVLLSQPGVDKSRVAYVGHDFGAMYGSVLASVEKGRVHAWALQAGTTEFPRWFLYGPPMEPQARERFIQQFAPIDPVTHIGSASPAPVLFQFGRQDKHVPVERADAFFAAAREPKKLLWYDASHGLNEQAIRDRQQWLIEVLRLRP
jgi:pimeloyl-ACP methyl ester carboxylesterase